MRVREHKYKKMTRGQIIVLVILGLASCAVIGTLGVLVMQSFSEPLPRGFQNTLTESPQNTSSGETLELRLVGYNYQLRDAGDGWNRGRVDLAFENTTSSPFPPDHPPRSWGASSLDNAYVETEEGRGYPAQVLCQVADTRTGPRYEEVDNPFYAMPAIPPGFCLTGGWAYGDSETPIKRWDPNWPGWYYGSYWGNCHLEFRAAGAAHPTVVMFPNRPDWTINLVSASGTSPQMPTSLSTTSFQPLSSISGTVVFDEPNGLRITLSGCIRDRNDDFITALLVNQDQFDESSAGVLWPAITHITDQGEARYVPATSLSFSLGPGQIQEELFYKLLGGRAGEEYTHIVMHWPDGRYAVYTTAGCLSE